MKLRSRRVMCPICAMRFAVPYYAATARRITVIHGDPHDFEVAE